MGPTQRTTPGNLVAFNCTAGPFGSSDFYVTWMKDRDEHPASAQRLVTEDKAKYTVTSKVWVTLDRQDVSSEMTCEVTHRHLAEPLRKSMNLSQVLRVGKLESLMAEAILHLTWMENRHKVQTVESPPVTRNPDGTYSLEHTWQAEATLNRSEFACWVVQDEQPPVQANITLQAQAPSLGKGQVTVTWLKNNHKLLKSQTSIHSLVNSYNVTSSVLVPLQADDMPSLILCHVKHRSTLVFQKTISLDQYLRVTVCQASPSLDLVAVNCHVQRFYPQSVRLTWMENCRVFQGAKQPTPKQNSDGTYTLESLQLVNASVQGSERVLTCPATPALIFVAFLLGFKVLLVIGFVVTYICRWRNL
ncbi:signal-regulatory protein alpha-like protein [Camelus ferus]|nr:signal-regulatory protein alpha-like protein [Camelus ferus]